MKRILLIVMFSSILLAGCVGYEKYSSTDVVKMFEDATLEVGDYRSMTVDDYGPAPLQAKEGTRFFIPSLCSDCGGRIMSFKDQDGLDATKHYYDELGKGSAMFFSWTFVKDNILVQINGDLSEEQARKYEKALTEMK